MTSYFRVHRLSLLTVLVLAVAACGGGSSDDSGGGNSGACDGTGSVSLSGTVTYEYVPAVHPGSGSAPFLDFDNSERRPVRGAQVRAVCPDNSSVYATTSTDDDGGYELSVPENVDVQIRVRALMEKSGSPSWNVSVVDNTQDQAVWTLQGDSFDSATGNATVDLHASSGWTGSSYGDPRAAAPFAIMDSIYTAMRKVLEADAAAQFPALKVNWSAGNLSSTGSRWSSACGSSAQQYPFEDGCIGTSFYADYGSGGRNIFVLGEAAEDTDEFDNHVIIHEWGHYYEDAFSRSDSIGGHHTEDTKLDLRVAFGEAWGNAWAGIATDEPLYVDTFGTGLNGFSFDVEDHVAIGHPGWWNETSLQEIIYDLYDSGPEDAVSLGFAPLHEVLINGQRTTAAMTSVFPFVHALKQNVDIATDGLIDQMLNDTHEIAPVPNEWGDDRVDNFDEGPNDDSSDDYASPIHAELTPNAVQDSLTTPVMVCTTDRFADPIDASNRHEFNRLGVRRFLRFEVPASGSWTITVDGSAEMDVDADPDFYVYLNGDRLLAADADSSATSVESASTTLATGHTYVIEVLDWNNADDDPATGGDVCHDLTFEKTS